MNRNEADGTTGENTGTAGTNCTAVEYGNSHHHVTNLTLASVAYTIGDNAALADSALVYTFPAGHIVVHGVYSSVGLSLTTGTPTTDTPEVGLGTTAASGVNATLGAVAATAEDIAGPAVMDDIAGTAEVFGTGAATKPFEILPAAAHTVYLNIADTWADVDDTAATMSGTVNLVWSFVEGV